MSDIVLKDKNGKKNTYSGIDVINIADTKGIYNRYVAEPQGEIQITSNGTFDVKTIATAKVNVAGGGSTDCDGCIIEVDVLPTENIDETALYKVGDSYYKLTKEFKDVLGVNSDGVYSYVNLYAEFEGITIELYYVDNYENVENPLPMDQSTMIVPAYYDASRDDVFIYDGSVWFPFSEIGGDINGGAITSEAEVTIEGYYYALLYSGWKLIGGSEYNGEVVVE